MRSRLALAGAFALVATTAPAHATPPTLSRHLPVINSEDSPARDTFRLRVTPLPADARALGLEVEITYPGSGLLPVKDSLDVGSLEPRAVSARSREGRVLSSRVTGDAAGGYRIELSLSPGWEIGGRGVHVRFEQAAPPPRRFGWVYSLVELSWAASFRVNARGFSSTVVVPAGMSLPGQSCQVEPEGAHARVCARPSGDSHATPVLVPTPVDVTGLAFLLLTVTATLTGFWRTLKGRARELAEAVDAVVVLPPEGAGGAYRAPPSQTVIVSVDRSRDARALSLRATLSLLPALASTAALAFFASGVSPWPLPSLLAAWIAVVGSAAWLLVARR